MSRSITISVSHYLTIKEEYLCGIIFTICPHEWLPLYFYHHPDLIFVSSDVIFHVFPILSYPILFFTADKDQTKNLPFPCDAMPLPPALSFHPLQTFSKVRRLFGSNCLGKSLVHNHLSKGFLYSVGVLITPASASIATRTRILLATSV